MLTFLAATSALFTLGYFGVLRPRLAQVPPGMAAPSEPNNLHAAPALNCISQDAIASRASFYEMLNERLAAQSPAAVFLLDLNDFSRVNEETGFALGDIVLNNVGKRLCANAPGGT